MVNIRLDPRMRDALKKIGDKQFSGVSAVIKQAIEEFLEKRGIDWRKEPEKKSSRKPKGWSEY